MLDALTRTPFFVHTLENDPLRFSVKKPELVITELVRNGDTEPNSQSHDITFFFSSFFSSFFVCAPAAVAAVILVHNVM